MGKLEAALNKANDAISQLLNNSNYLYQYKKMDYYDLKFGKYSGATPVFTANSLDVAKMYNVTAGDELILTIFGNTFVYNYVFFDNSNNVISSFKPTVSGIIDVPIIVPIGATKLALACELNNSYKQYVKVKKFISHDEAKNPWFGKKIAYFGTSIPAGGFIGIGNPNSYPYLIGEKLGATLTNEAVGSSCVCTRSISLVNASTNPYGFTSNFEAVSRCLGNTIAEMQWVVNWINYRLHGGTYLNSGAYDANVFTSNIPATWDSNSTALALYFSYENKLVSSHLGANRKDLYIFEHGHNDKDTDNFTTIPADNYDRFSYIGTMNFLIRLILLDNPRARIVIQGHYESDLYPTIVEAQKIVANYWSIPICELDKKLCFGQKQITTTGYWGTDQYWRDSGGSPTSLTMKQIWLYDNLHPHSDRSGRAISLIANNIASWLATVSGLTIS